MKEIEDLLRQDRAAGIPEPPDVRYTVAAVRRRLEQPKPAQQSDWPVVAAGAGLLVGAAVAALFMGVSALWLGVLPVALLALSPLLFRKGVE